jgi:hypothetical protein
MNLKKVNNKIVTICEIVTCSRKTNPTKINFGRIFWKGHEV